MSSDTGWARAETHPLEGDGWCDELAAVKDGGWDSMERIEVDKAAPVSHEGGWGGKQEATNDNGWDSLVKSDANMTAPAAQTDNWSSREGQNPRNGTPKGGFMHPSRRSMNAADSAENPGSSERQSGNFAPSGTNTVPLGRRKRFVEADVKSGFTDDKQCEEKDHMGWGSGALSVAGDDFGWGASNQEEENTHANSTQQGSGQDNWTSEMDWETSCSEPASESLRNACQTVPESETLGMNGWGHDNDWNSKGNSEAYETAPSNPPDSWDAMEGQSARKGSKRSTDITDKTDKQSADDRRSGRFAPSGSNTVPLGKRRTGMKPDVSNNEPESMMTQKTQPSGVKEDQEDQTGWANCEQSTAVEDFGWDNSSQVPCSNNCPKPSPSSWDSTGFKSPVTQPSRGFVEQDGTPSPRKKFNRVSSGDSWAGFASKSPQSQSRRPRLRSLMNSPEYSELDQLYKATNKILHHNEYQLGDKLNTEDEKFILEKILVHHQDKEAKVGCGVDYVMIDSHAEHQVSCFWVVRKDGTKTDFSYWKCLEGLYETKYSQGATKDGVKDETNDGCKWGPDSKALSKSDQEGAKGSYHIGGHSGAPTKGDWDKGKTKGSWNMGVDTAALSKSMFDKEEAKDSWDMGASSAAPTKNFCDLGDGWDTLAGFTAPTKTNCDQGEAKDSWDMGANSAANSSDQATRKDVPQDEAKDGWGG